MIVLQVFKGGFKWGQTLGYSNYFEIKGAVLDLHPLIKG